MLKKLAVLVCVVAFGLAVYSPAADACPGMDETSIAKKDKKEQKDKKVAKKKKVDKEKAKDKKKAKDEKKKETAKKVTRR